MPEIEDLQPATVTQLNEHKQSVEVLLDNMRRTLRDVQALYGSPAAGIATLLDKIGDDYDLIEITSPDKDVKVGVHSYGNSDRTIGETGWTVKLSKGGGPLTVINNHIAPQPVDEPEDPAAD